MRPDPEFLTTDLRELDTDALEQHLLEQSRNSKDPVGDKFKFQLEMRNNDSNRVVISDDGFLAFETDSLLKKVGDTTKFYAKDLGKGIKIGANRAVEGVGLIGVSLAESLNIASDGAVERFEKAFDDIYEQIGETETGLGSFASVATQYVVPGGVAVKGMNAILRNKATAQSLLSLLGAEAATVGAVSLPEDGNLVDIIMTATDLDKDKAESLARETFNYIATIETEKDPASIFEAKVKNIVGDLVVIGPVFRMLKEFGDVFRAAKNNPKIKTELINRFSEEAVGGKVPQGEVDNLFNYKTISEEQSIDSARTDVNFKRGAIPALYNKIDKSIGWKNNTTSLEIGSGAGNVSDDFLQSKGVTNIKYDPYRLTEQQNESAVSSLKELKESAGGVDTVVIANVLNVIPEESVRIRVLEQAKYAVKDDGKVYIDSHKANKQGATSLGFQLGRSNEEYIPEIESVFGKGSAKIIKVSGRNFIEVTPTKVEGN